MDRSKIRNSFFFLLRNAKSDSTSPSSSSTASVSLIQNDNTSDESSISVTNIASELLFQKEGPSKTSPNSDAIETSYEIELKLNTIATKIFELPFRSQ